MASRPRRLAAALASALARRRPPSMAAEPRRPRTPRPALGHDRGVRARRDREDPPRRDDVHRRRPVHRELRLHRRRRQRLRRLRRALRRHRRRDRHQRLQHAGSLPLGTKVDFVEGGSLVSSGTRVGTGTLVYSSWLTMQQAGTTDAEHLRLQRPRAGQGRPGVRRHGQPVRPVLGRPGRRSTPPAPPPATTVYSYGNSSLRAGISALSPKQRHAASATTATAGRTPSTP